MHSSRAALTRATAIQHQKGYDAKTDIVLVRGVKSKADFAAAAKEANGLEISSGKVGNISLFSHSGWRDGRVSTSPPEKSSQLTTAELNALHVNWAENATASFYGCNTALLFSSACRGRGVAELGCVFGRDVLYRLSQRKFVCGALWLDAAHVQQHCERYGWYDLHVLHSRDEHIGLKRLEHNHRQRSVERLSCGAGQLYTLRQRVLQHYFARCSRGLIELERVVRRHFIHCLSKWLVVLRSVRIDTAHFRQHRQRHSGK